MSDNNSNTEQQAKESVKSYYDKYRGAGASDSEAFRIAKPHDISGIESAGAGPILILTD